MKLTRTAPTAALLFVAATSAIADTSGRHSSYADFLPSYADSLPSFNYADAVAERPLRVTATSEDGKCHFTLSMVGYQQGAIPNSSLSGRIEQGECGGQPVQKGIALGSVTFRGNQAVLDRHMQVVVFEADAVARATLTTQLLSARICGDKANLDPQVLGRHSSAFVFSLALQTMGTPDDMMKKPGLLAEKMGQLICGQGGILQFDPSAS